MDSAEEAERAQEVLDSLSDDVSSALITGQVPERKIWRFKELQRASYGSDLVAAILILKLAESRTTPRMARPGRRSFKCLSFKGLQLWPGAKSLPKGP